MPRRRFPPSQTWQTSLANHVRDVVSLDVFTVPTAGLRVLFVLVVLAHHRRHVVHFNVTAHPTARRTAQQLVDAFPDDAAPASLLRDRDRVYGSVFRHRVTGMGLADVPTAPNSRWQNPFAERLIGSVRRECLAHVVVLREGHLRSIPAAYVGYSHRTRTHLALDTAPPISSRSRSPPREKSCSSPKSAACTTATSVWRHSQRPWSSAPCTGAAGPLLFASVRAPSMASPVAPISLPGPTLRIASPCLSPGSQPSPADPSGRFG